MPERLQRSLTDRQWTGVCGGIAEYFQIDSTLVRAFFVVATILTAGFFFLVYIALIIVMPLPGRAGPFDTSAPPPSGTGAAADATTPLPPASTPARTPPSPEAARRRRDAAGWFLIAIGIVFLLSNAGAFRFVDFRYIWPIALIAIGAFVILQRTRS
ncbi:MAG TPA: PspC domain-containing protein [Candidatus Dormibacteraeota bacterium]|nr:PspC domain-containing protein [Candidatus Dormibacteraeota bacterium]